MFNLVSVRPSEALTQKYLDKNPEAWVFDVHQSAVHRPRFCHASTLGESIPCHIGHGCMWHVGRKRPLLAHEVLLCNGSAVVPEITGKRPAFPSLEMLGNGSLSQRDLVNLAGNGWHIPAVGKVIVWLLASVREQDCALRRVVDPGDFDDDAEEEVI